MIASYTLSNLYESLSLYGPLKIKPIFLKKNKKRNVSNDKELILKCSVVHNDSLTKIKWMIIACASDQFCGVGHLS